MLGIADIGWRWVAAFSRRSGALAVSGWGRFPIYFVGLLGHGGWQRHPDWGSLSPPGEALSSSEVAHLHGR